MKKIPWLSSVLEYFLFRASAILTGLMEGVRILLTGLTLIIIPFIQSHLEKNSYADNKNSIIASWVFGGIFTAVFSKTISSLNTKYKDKEIKKLKTETESLKEKNLLLEANVKSSPHPDKSWKIHHLHTLNCAKEEVISLLYGCLGEGPSKEDQAIILEAIKKINKSDTFKPEKQEAMYDFATETDSKNVEEENYIKQKEESEEAY